MEFPDKVKSARKLKIQVIFQGMRCEGACKIHSEKCAGCACVRLVLWRAMCDRTFAHFLEQNDQIMLFFVLKNILF